MSTVNETRIREYRTGHLQPNRLYRAGKIIAQCKEDAMARHLVAELNERPYLEAVVSAAEALWQCPAGDEVYRERLRDQLEALGSYRSRCIDMGMPGGEELSIPPAAPAESLEDAAQALITYLEAADRNPAFRYLIPGLRISVNNAHFEKLKTALAVKKGGAK